MGGTKGACGGGLRVKDQGGDVRGGFTKDLNCKCLAIQNVSRGSGELRIFSGRCGGLV